MTNTYYTPTGSPADHSAGVALSMRNEFNLIQAGFDYLSGVISGFTGAALVTATDSGTAAAHVLTPTKAVTSYTAMMCLLYLPAVTNTGALTVNVSGLGAKSIKTLAGADPSAGDIIAAQPILLIYNGTNFITLAGSEFLSKTGNQTLTGNLAVTGDISSATSATLPAATTIGTLTAAELSYVHGVTSGIQAQLNALAPKANPTFTGTVTIPVGVNATDAAQKAYVDATATASGMVPIWVSGTTYSIGNSVQSPINYQTYRRKTAGAGTTDPSADATNWAQVGASLAGNTFSGAQNMAYNQVQQALLIDSSYVFLDKGNSSTTTQTFNYDSGSHQKVTATGNHTIATSNWPPSGNLGSLLMEYVNGGAFTLTFPTINWIKPDGTTTTSISTYLAANTGRTALQASGTDFILLWTRDAGTTIYGKLL